MRRVVLTLILPSMIGQMCPSYQGKQYNTMETTLLWLHMYEIVNSLGPIHIHRTTHNHDLQIFKSLCYTTVFDYTELAVQDGVGYWFRYCNHNHIMMNWWWQLFLFYFWIHETWIIRSIFVKALISVQWSFQYRIQSWKMILITCMAHPCV